MSVLSPLLFMYDHISGINLIARLSGDIIFIGIVHTHYCLKVIVVLDIQLKTINWLSSRTYSTAHRLRSLNYIHFRKQVGSLQVDRKLCVGEVMK